MHYTCIDFTQDTLSNRWALDFHGQVSFHFSTDMQMATLTKTSHPLLPLSFSLAHFTPIKLDKNLSHLDL